MALTIVGSSSCGPQIHQFQIQKRSTTTTKTTTKLVVVSAKSGGGGGANNNKNKGSSNSSSFKAGGKFDSKNRRTTSTTLKEDRDYNDNNNNNNEQLLNGFQGGTTVINDGIITEKDIEIEAKLRELPGLEKDFWEGPEWDTFGFIVQYLWAFGIVFALVACGVAVATYNEGAADFKQTLAYKESIQSREFLEEPESSNSDIFESNPTEEAPALE